MHDSEVHLRCNSHFYDNIILSWDIGILNLFFIKLFTQNPNRYPFIWLISLLFYLSPIEIAITCLNKKKKKNENEQNESMSTVISRTNGIRTPRIPTNYRTRSCLLYVVNSLVPH